MCRNVCFPASEQRLASHHNQLYLDEDKEFELDELKLRIERRVTDVEGGGNEKRENGDQQVKLEADMMC